MPKRKKKKLKLYDFETFRVLCGYDVSNLKQDKPSCFNGEVRVRKYRVIFEPVDEPIEVLQQRVQKLWDECDNFHNCEPLRDIAIELEYELKGFYGNKLRKRR